MDVPVFSIEACTLGELPAHSKVFNKQSIDYYLWVKLPNYVNADYQLYQINVLRYEYEECKLSKFFEREPGKPWIRIISKVLDLDIGKHTYQLQFVNRFTNDSISIYFAYTVQDDSPSKPYIYMNRSCEV